jgi:acetyl-CoA carboxylase biotin carboxyl carrier protein
MEFKAVLSPNKAKPASKSSTAVAEMDEDGEPKLAEITAPLVGYYSPGPKNLVVGERVETGDMVATIAQLGIVNEVESKVSGEVVEVCVEGNQPVMYGQVLARVKE